MSNIVLKSRELAVQASVLIAASEMVQQYMVLVAQLSEMNARLEERLRAYEKQPIDKIPISAEE